MSTDDPFRLRVLYALTDALKTITPADGYSYDLSDFVAEDGLPQPRVFRGRPWFGESDPIPMVSVLEALDFFDDILAEAPGDSTGGEFDWQLVLQGFVNDDPTHPTDPAYRLLRDVRRRLGEEKRRTSLTIGRRGPDPLGTTEWGVPGCRVLKLSFGLGNVRAADDVSAKAYFALLLTLRMTEDSDGA